MRTIYGYIITASLLAVTASFGAQAQASSRYEIQVAAPADQSTVFSDLGDVTVQLAVTPALLPGESVELLLDGAPVAPLTDLLDFPLNGVLRGEHVLQARVIDTSGNVAATSPATIFYVWQASLLFPSRQGTAGAIGSAATSRTVAMATQGHAVHAR